MTTTIEAGAIVGVVDSFDPTPGESSGADLTCQRPQTAKGFAFLRLEDETGISNAIVKPDEFEANRLVLTGEHLVVLEGELQNQSGAVFVRVDRVEAFRADPATMASHEFH